jgi:glycosyltransferase involved in cell wall biosynthesis
MTADVATTVTESFSPIASTTARLLMLPVFAEEGWPSIDLSAEMLAEHWTSQAEMPLTRAQPGYRHRIGCLPGLGASRFGRNADRLWNRFSAYPRWVRNRRSNFDVFHVCDHSYSQLIHQLPAHRTGVLCQDLDTFRCLLVPVDEPRPRWFRRMTQRILDGFQKAAVVFHTTQHVRRQILEHGLIGADRLVHAPLGIAPEFARRIRQPEAPTESSNHPYLLHVGSCVPRKRIDVLLRVFAAVRRQRPDIRLIKVGGEFTPDQQRLIVEHSLSGVIEHHLGLSRTRLASLYRHAAVTLVPSDREGLGLPVIEALACGSIVLANDIPPLREGGGCAAMYQPISSLDAWTQTILDLLSDPSRAPTIEQRTAQGLQFTWQRHASVIADVYTRLAAGLPPTTTRGT